jgi:ubiquinone/menaquinone biosynthesis C-methylase UbiE
MEVFGDRVFSCDYIAINSRVTACDMKSVPVQDRYLDIIVFSLSLMNKNWPDYILEAKRCLVTNGTLLIAVTTKSLTERLSNLRDILKAQGFDIYDGKVQPPFTFIEANKRDLNIL